MDTNTDGILAVTLFRDKGYVDCRETGERRYIRSKEFLLLEKVILNLSGLEKCDPRFPWVYNARADGSIAVDVYWYIDDGRPTADTV